MFKLCRILARYSYEQTNIIYKGKEINDYMTDCTSTEALTVTTHTMLDARCIA